jgi:hypothetical protein
LSGAAAPQATGGMGSGAATARIRRALVVAWSTGTLPATVVTASTRASGERRASRIASASSMPGSESISRCRVI